MGVSCPSFFETSVEKDGQFSTLPRSNDVIEFLDNSGNNYPVNNLHGPVRQGISGLRIGPKATTIIFMNPATLTVQYEEHAEDATTVQIQVLEDYGKKPSDRLLMSEDIEEKRRQGLPDDGVLTHVTLARLIEYIERLALMPAWD